MDAIRNGMEYQESFQYKCGNKKRLIDGYGLNKTEIKNATMTININTLPINNFFLLPHYPMTLTLHKMTQESSCVTTWN